MKKKIKYFLSGFSIFLDLLVGYVFTVTSFILVATSNGYIAVLYFILGFIIGLFVILDTYDLGEERHKQLGLKNENKIKNLTKKRKFFTKIH